MIRLLDAEPAGRDAMQIPGIHVSNQVVTYTHDAVGRLTRQDNANGTYSTWGFDEAGRASQVESRKSDDAVILSMDYTRDNVGNPIRVAEQLLDADDSTTHIATVTYGYDDLDRLTSEKREGYQPIWYEYTMDPVGNRTQFVEKDQGGSVTGTTNATCDAANRLLTYGATTYTWDNNGNQLSEIASQGITTMTWDYENKLVGLKDGAVMTFTYDTNGLRRSKEVEGTMTSFAYSGVRLLQELDSDGVTQAADTLAPTGDIWDSLIGHRKSGASRSYAFDVLGTTRALTDGSEGVAAIFTDDAWGNVLNVSDATATPHQYVGRRGYYLDDASGLYLLTQRYYDPTTGRFCAEDPAKHDIGWFSYAASNPVANVDPTGLASCWFAYGEADVDAKLTARGGWPWTRSVLLVGIRVHVEFDYRQCACERLASTWSVHLFGSLPPSAAVGMRRKCRNMPRIGGHILWPHSNWECTLAVLPFDNDWILGQDTCCDNRVLPGHCRIHLRPDIITGQFGPLINLYALLAFVGHLHTNVGRIYVPVGECLITIDPPSYWK